MMNCVNCSQEMVEIWYGYPTPELIQQSQNDEIALGGWPPKEYTHFCVACQETNTPTH